MNELIDMFLVDPDTLKIVNAIVWDPANPAPDTWTGMLLRPVIDGLWIGDTYPED